MSDHAPELQAPQISFDDFLRVDIRVGTVVSADLLEGARLPAIRMEIDFGEFGRKRSSAQITRYYTPEAIVGRQVVCVVNFPSKRIAGFVSEVLVLGAVERPGDVVLLQVERGVPNGTRIA